MGITKDRGYWYFVKRVPRRFAHVDPRSQVRTALHTDSRSEALARAPAVEAEFLAMWEALAAGEVTDAARRYEAARQLCAARGFVYRPIDELVRDASDDDLTARLAGLASPDHVAPAAEVEAMLGLVDQPSLTVTEALPRFLALTRDRLVGMSTPQLKRWRQPRERAVRNFVTAAGDLELSSISRADAVTFREWWIDRVQRDGLNPESANKDFGHLRDVLGTVSDLLGLDLDLPFDKMRLKKAHSAEVPPFSTAWLRGTFLAPGALDGLNPDARDPLLVMINTGARPSEILSSRPEDFAVHADVPHLSITQREDRRLKTAQSERNIPLAGVSLDAARRIVARGGVSARYAFQANRWSAVTNKFLTENKLRESPAHRVYSLRHAFEDRLLEAGVDERLRVELMGHKYGRPAYGRGGSLKLKAAAVARIAL